MHTTTTNLPQEALTLPDTSILWIIHAPQTPQPFHGDAFEDVEDWLDAFERVAAVNNWDDRRKMGYVYFALQDSARIWFVNHESSLTNWQEFR